MVEQAAFHPQEIAPMRFALSSILSLFLLATPIAARAADAPKAKLDDIQHIVVIYLENRSFDNLFGTFRGANGFSSARETYPQTDEKGIPYTVLPAAMNTEEKTPLIDTRFPTDLSNAPFPIDKYVPLDQKTGDLVHRFYQEQMQINGGRMDRFAAVSNARGLAMGYYDTRKTALWRYAKDYVLADNFFHAAYGGSFINHFWLVCACTPRFPNAPKDLLAQLDDNSTLIKDGAVTPDFYAVNTVRSVYAPRSLEDKDPKKLLPPQDHATIGDRLSAAGVSWAWYSGGWADALAGHPAPLYQYHHQPFAYFKNFGDGTKGRAEHLKDETEMMTAIAANALPAVSFFKPLGDENEHPGYADVASGDRKLGELLAALEKMPSWRHTAVIVTFDENGGFWDHVAPPKLDRWGPGTRVPTVIISPLAKRRYVDHTLYDTTSILRLIEQRFGLPPLGSRDLNAHDLTAAFDF
jgi:phospholipase C